MVLVTGSKRRKGNNANELQKDHFLWFTVFTFSGEPDDFFTVIYSIPFIYSIRFIVLLHEIVSRLIYINFNEVHLNARD